ncbi:MAG: hypothetical protein OEU40_05775 [Gammaproteobacteria bacterium]|nr:hypothetical protein [Gammaproteobacteria bacterium]
MPRRRHETYAELCHKEGINQNLYYRWSKEFLEAGEKRWPRPAACAGRGNGCTILT